MIVHNYDRYLHYTESQYNKKGLSYFFMRKQANKKLIPYINSIKKKKILEVGPGYGYYTKYLLENDNDVRGLDVNPELGVNVGIEITKGNADRLQDMVHNKYDRILSFFMTEYLNETQMQEFVHQGVHQLERDGIFATTVIVNRGLGWIYIVLARLKGIKKYCYSLKQIRKMVGVEKNVRMIPLNTILSIPFAVLVEVKAS